MLMDGLIPGDGGLRWGWGFLVIEKIGSDCLWTCEMTDCRLQSAMFKWVSWVSRVCLACKVGPSPISDPLCSNPYVQTLMFKPLCSNPYPIPEPTLYPNPCIYALINHVCVIIIIIIIVNHHLITTTASPPASTHLAPLPLIFLPLPINSNSQISPTTSPQQYTFTTSPGRGAAFSFSLASPSGPSS